MGGGGGVLCHGIIVVIGTMSDMVSNSLESRKSFVSLETWKRPSNFLVSRYTSVLKIHIWQDGHASWTKVCKFYRCVLDKSSNCSCFPVENSDEIAVFVHGGFCRQRFLLG